MSDERPDGMLGGLPQTRPHRRSTKRPAAPAVRSADTKPQPASEPRQVRRSAKTKPKPAPKPRAKPKAARRPQARPEPAPSPAPNDGPLGTAVQAAAELAEIGLSASARALRGVLSRLPRP